MRESTGIAPPGLLPAAVIAIAGAARDAGGRAVVAGGWVRDRLLGIEPRDIDVEILGLTESDTEHLLSRFGRVRRFGRAFGVWHVDGLDADFSPAAASVHGRRLDDASLAHAYREAARRRDLTINAVAYDPLADTILDPWDGRTDLAARRLRATDPIRFVEDPLRGLRVARLMARHGFEPDAELEGLCTRLDIGAVAVERVYEEFSRLLVEPDRPAVGLGFLVRTGQLGFAPELTALAGVEQDPTWHPEGDALTHTLMVVDAAAGLRSGLDRDETLALMWAALTHDLGKAEATARTDGRLTSHGHERAGAALAARLLGRLRAPRRLIDTVTGLVRHHRAPPELVKQAASAPAYRRLARRAAAHGFTLALLERLARADALGRDTPAARGGRWPVGDDFLRAAGDTGVDRGAPCDVVLGRHLIARGLSPGPEFAGLLARCRAIQDDTGWREPGSILDRMLAERRD